MIADEIKKAGQATIDQSVDLLTYNLTNTWNTYSGTHSVLAALACDTGGSYWHDDDYGEWHITFTQDVCRYNGTPVNTYMYVDHGSGEYSSYELYDFNNNQIYYSESAAPTSFTVRGIKFQNNKQSFQLLSSGQPSYVDNYHETASYSEAGLFNTSVVPSKSTCSCVYNRYLTSVGYRETKTLRTIYAGSACKMVMINAVQSDNYNWDTATYPAAGGDVRLTISGIVAREANFNYYNPGNLMMILQPNQTATVTVSASVRSGQATNILCTIQEIQL